MSFERMYQFLEELQHNNHKEWMDAHRNRYQEIRMWFIEWLDQMNQRLAAIDSEYTDTPGKKGINRINNNLLYHPNRPVYKDHFGAGLDQRSKQGDFYIQIGVSASFIAGGYYRPEASVLASIREAIDYNGAELKRILNKESFQKRFGDLIDEGDCLDRAPKGYENDHPQIDLLKYRTFAVQHDLSRKEVVSPYFNDKVVELYLEMLPFRRYLNQAVSV